MSDCMRVNAQAVAYVTFASIGACQIHNHDSRPSERLLHRRALSSIPNNRHQVAKLYTTYAVP